MYATKRITVLYELIPPINKFSQKYSNYYHNKENYSYE